MVSEIKYVRKRDGKRVKFDPQNIIEAIEKTVNAVGNDNIVDAVRVAKQVVELLEIVYRGDRRVPTVETIQDLVEKMLIDNGYARVAKAYILYRDQHEKLRDAQKLLKSAIGMVDSYIGQDDWRVRENSNMGYSLQGLNNHVSSLVSSHYWLNKIYSKEIKSAHLEGDFHVHDLGLLAVYCCGWDMKDLLTNGFKGAYGKIQSRPAKHFRTALGQIVNFFYTLQGESAGAQAFANFDTLLAPFIRYDKLTYKEILQAIQEFVYNMNIPTRVGFQTPFTNITMDMTVPSAFQDEHVTIAGELKNETYGEFQKEMDLLNKAFCEIMLQGDAKGRVFTFPIPTYNITKDFAWENKQYDSLWEMTAKYGIPYFANFVNSDMSPDDARSMCCRLRLDNRELRKRGGGLFGSNPLTGSIGVITINMPRIGYLSHNKTDFFEKLEYLMDTARIAFKTKRKILERFTDQGLYPYSKFYLRDIKKRFNQYWANHFSTIGLTGMNECCINFLDKDISSEKGKNFSIEVLDFMRGILQKYQEKEGALYNLEATPAEGTGYRLARLDQEAYPKIKASGTDVPYYTNSTHLPVGQSEDIFDALTHQDGLQTLYTGGTVFHGFLGERIDDIETCKNLVKKISTNFHMPYFTLSPTFTVCPVHGYISGEHKDCPHVEKADIEIDEKKEKTDNKKKSIKS
ncbi:ribonucleoside triphosphate reductase [bacterium]|nr:ribonucleoside triphosphate reductase [bacterium]